MLAKRASGIELLIRKLERFGPLPEPERAALQSLPVRLQDYPRGHIIVSQGETTDESALVVSGITMRFKLLPDGLRQIVAVQVPGDFTDLHSFVLKPLDHAIAAAAPTRVARIPHCAIQNVILQHPGISRWLMGDLALDAAISRAWLATLGRRSAYQQLAHLFCELYYRMEWAGLVRDNRFEMVLTQADLGDACGLSTVHVNRSLQALRKDGLIVLESHAHTLLIPDIRRLAEAASFDASYLYLQG
jgi:CRP-like cAMP-binding protein